MNLSHRSTLLRNANNLLVSVRNVSEAFVIRNSSVDILDIKDPDRGALGRAEAQNIREILQMESRSNQLSSVAMGELVEIDFAVSEFLADVDPTKKLDFVKFGLSNCREIEIQKFLTSTMSGLPSHLTPVFCTYADSETADCPIIETVIDLAADSNVSWLLIDTFEKAKGNFFDLVPVLEFERLQALARSKGISIAIAGSLRSTDLLKAMALSPKIIGVRGAACSSPNRTSPITQESLDRFLGYISDYGLDRQVNA